MSAVQTIPLRELPMKPLTKQKIQSPQLPKPLSAGSIERLEDHGECAALELSNCDFSEQTAQDMLFEQVRFRRGVFTRSQLPRLRLLDVRMESADLSGASWEKARFRRVEFSGCRFLGTQLLEVQMEDVLFHGNIGGSTAARHEFFNGGRL